IDATAGSIAGADRFRPRRGPPGDDALRAGSTTHERGGAATWIPPRNRWRCARQPTLDDVALSGSKIPALRGNDRRLGAGQFDPIAEASELPDHSGRPVSLRLLAQGWASFLVP